MSGWEQSSTKHHSSACHRSILAESFLVSFSFTSTSRLGLTYGSIAQLVSAPDS